LPAEDRYHPTVIKALTKNGWKITGQQVSLKVSKRRLWVDIEATQANGTVIILIEVKGLEGRSLVNTLANAIGQYILYKAALKYLEIDTKQLFLAVPTAAHNGIFSEPLGKQVLIEADSKLLVFDPGTEEIVEWIT
jgi:hypothetical protein